MKTFGNNGPIIKSISIVLLSLCAFILVIAIIVKVDEYKKSKYTIDVKFDSNDIVQLTNKLPVSDEIGKSYNGTGIEKGIVEYKTFTITNSNESKVKYEIYLTKLENNIDDMRTGYIKLYLTDDKNNPLDGFETNKLKTYYELPALSDKITSRLLYSGYLVSGSSKKFILRSWVSDTYILSSKEEDFRYDIGVRIK